jgi:hypothetical protein
MAAPWRIFEVEFWLSAVANLLKDGGTMTPYSDMAAPYVGQYAGFWLSTMVYHRQCLEHALDQVRFMFT